MIRWEADGFRVAGATQEDDGWRGAGGRAVRRCHHQAAAKHTAVMAQPITQSTTKWLAVPITEAVMATGMARPSQRQREFRRARNAARPAPSAQPTCMLGIAAKWFAKISG